ncbi:hypothetical protein NOR_00532 [Metarhizium rileyi]|uniref:Fungal specific transcription factor n=1 Tax=Metarhizium rileyi (strain RCEF 4871) TaxID=1649241 RepID=A0A167KMX2_METRR|nr:hypothetical protein NOR_00532 [Metarhizium rileyi RCEF 4871]TWU77636.1 hypothetical protein ED733_008039 [Metarhizium rileyi]
MEQGLSTSMWAGGPASRKEYHLRHDTRSRSLPPPVSAVVAGTRDVLETQTCAAKADCLARLQAFQRFEQTCHRLRWKFIDLENAYGRALGPAEWGFAPADAERNFKVDFHEFYVWIEQAVVFLLMVYGVVVHRGGLSRSETRSAGLNGSASHAYHHNVLKALEEEDNPLHGTMGVGEVIQALWKAKELRNRWKDAAEGRETPPLKMYDLRWIVTRVLGGLEEAYLLAKREVEGDLGRSEDHGVLVEDGWEWMVESMDWEP